jgi:AraC-like DNA-binding protein
VARPSASDARIAHQPPVPRAADDEFASALLVRLAQQELARQGLLAEPSDDPSDAAAPDAAAPPSAPRASSAGERRRTFGPTLGEARVPLAPKRALLAAVAERAGYRPLLRVGEGLARLVAEAPDDPVLAALVRAADPFDALARWRRLEGFLHSRHRLELVASTATAPGRPRRRRPGRRERRGDARRRGNVLVVRHAGPAGEPPAPAEDALILGVMIALFRYVGAPDLTVSLLGADGGACRSSPAPACTSRPPRGAVRGRSPRGGSRGRTTGGPERRDGRTGGRRAPDPRPLDALPLDAPPLATRLAAVIAADLGRSWTLAAAARALDRAGGPSLAPRTLQRRLAAEQATFPGVVRSARLAAAGRLLVDGALPVGVIGFVCGFSDQAHLTRQFRRQTGLTPAAYRRTFGRVRGQDRGGAHAG